MKEKNHLKRIVPILIALLSLFTFTTSFDCQAQEKNSNSTLKIKNTSYQYGIDKKTTDEQLEWIKKEVNNEKVALLTFNKIKRNDAGEIISISTSFKDDRGSSQEKYQYNSNGISPFMVEINQNEGGAKYLKIVNSNQNTSHFDDSEYSNLSSNKNLYSEILDEDNNGNIDDVFSGMMQQMERMQQEMLNQQDSFFKEFIEIQEENDNKTKK